MGNNKGNKGNLTWAKAFDAFTSKHGQTPEGVGWYTMKEVKQKLGVGQNRLHRFLREGADNGSVEVYEGSQIGKNGRLVRCIWYRLK